MDTSIKHYWEQRAAENKATSQATTNDIHLRRLELATFVEHIRRMSLPDGATLLDVGCGDGKTTLGIAREFPNLRIIGVDYSDNMIQLARAELASQPAESKLRVEFRCGDAKNLGGVLADELFDVVITDRCLINLESADYQYAVLREIAGRLRPGGLYLGIENFLEGQDALNAARAAVGLQPIPVRWHNLFFREVDFRTNAAECFESVQFEDFSSSYYFATRVIYSEMCRLRGEEPDYNHEIHQLAVKLPAFGAFSPIKLIVARRSRSDKSEPSLGAATFQDDRANSICALAQNLSLREQSLRWLTDVSRHKYCYNFQWLGRPIIQFPQDIQAVHELIWETKPDVVVETGVAHGGSLVLSASCLELIGGNGRVLGVDIDIRAENRAAIESHPLSKRIHLLQGSSTDEQVARQVFDFCRGSSRTLVILDSNHTHEHVLRELNLYSPLVGRGSYLVVMDSVIEDLPEDFFPNRPWGRGNNPKTAIWEFLRSNDRFEIDRELEAKLQITVAPDGYLRCLKD